MHFQKHDFIKQELYIYKPIPIIQIMELQIQWLKVKSHI